MFPMIQSLAIHILYVEIYQSVTVVYSGAETLHGNDVHTLSFHILHFLYLTV